MQSWRRLYPLLIHPLLREADFISITIGFVSLDSSPPARGRHMSIYHGCRISRFIPSCEGQTMTRSLVPLSSSDSSPPARGRLNEIQRKYGDKRFIPSCEGQTLSVYAAFSRLKHLIVQFAQMPFSTRYTSFPLLIICLKNILFVFLQIFFKLS